MKPKSPKETKKRPYATKKSVPKRLFTREEMRLDENLNEKKRNENLFRKMKKYWPLSKLSGRIFLIYFLVVMLGGFLLSIPGIVTNSSFNWNFLVGVFTASSGFSDTGITITNVSHDYSFLGQLITILLIETGGIGVLTFKIVLYLALNRKISVNDTMIAQTERGSSIPSSTIELIRDGFVWLTIVQILAAFLLFFGFFFMEPGTQTENNIISYPGPVDLGPGQLDTVSPYRNFAKSLWFAIYHSTSAMNNAGFDIISGSSLQPYNVEGHRAYLIQIIFMFEWVIGGLGYPTFHDIKRKIKAHRMGQKVRFSLFTKLNFCVYLILLVLGPLMVFTSEIVNKDNSLIFNYYKYSIGDYGVPTARIIDGAKPWYVVMMDIIFNTTSTRNAGFSTINVNDFNAGSKTIMSALMFIGSAPSSTAGGIRTTTLAIIFLATWSIIRNNSKTTAFKKTIPDATVKRAFAAFFISMCLVTLSVIIIFIDSGTVLSKSQDRVGNVSIIQIITLITSAFGTVGLNPFTGGQMLAFGALTKLVLILTMFIGQLGMSNTLLIFVKPSQRQSYGYLTEDVVIG